MNNPAKKAGPSRKAANGRSVSESMRLRSFKAFLALQPKPRAAETIVYRGFTITGSVGKKWFIDNDPRLFTTRKRAEEAVDVCLALRAELAKETP